MRRWLIRSISSGAEFEFQRTCDKFLEVSYKKHLAEQLDIDEFEDSMISDGVLTLKLKGNKIYVINKQTPNKQIWLSSPFSGPKRYEFIGESWVNLTDQHKLVDLLSKELTQATSTPIVLNEK